MQELVAAVGIDILDESQKLNPWTKS
jgi:hypothetical protein